MIDFQNYIGRIKQTSPGEVAYRARRLLLAEKLKNTVLKRKAVVTAPSCIREWVQRIELPRFEYMRQANTTNNGQPPTGQTPATLNTDPDSIRAFENDCRNLFFTSVGRRCGGIDIRSVWEPARLQHLVQPLLCDKSPKKHAAQAEILHWIADNPFLFGPHYLSPMECGLRVPVFFFCLKSMADKSWQDADVVAAAIYRHAWWVYRNLSLHNSLGNHTVCECIGLVFAGAVFCHTTEGKQWLTRGCRLLDQEIDHQILPDGGPAEQSITYHRFVLDLYWLAYGFLNVNGLYGCQRWKKRLEAGESFLAAFETGKSRTISIGDSDDGQAVAPGIHPCRSAVKQQTQRFLHFADAGYTVIRDGGLLLTFDHGPLGMAPLYNHGHADALSITLSYRGKPVLIDPGTYRYNNAPEWRRYFRSTRAHNTVTVDGLDQANQASGFIWTQPYQCKVVDCRESGNGLSVEARHNGYRRLKNPVRHFRRISYRAPDALHIRDRFTGLGRHAFELHFHLGETIAIDRIGRWWRLDFGSFFVFLTVLEQTDTTLALGRKNLPLGWNAPAYGQKQPCHVVAYRRSGPPRDTTFTTAIVFQDKPYE